VDGGWRAFGSTVPASAVATFEWQPPAWSRNGPELPTPMTAVPEMPSSAPWRINPDAPHSCGLTPSTQSELPPAGAIERASLPADRSRARYLRCAVVSVRGGGDHPAAVSRRGARGDLSS
jgi:hypothetical protein